VQRFLAHFKPRIGILMETEVWPNLSALCAQQGVALVLANARLSEKSLKQALRLAWLAKPTYRQLTAVWAQTQDDAARLKQLGAPVLGVFGNLKFDATPNAEQLARGRAWRANLARPVVMLASSREGEEAQWVDLLKAKPEHSVQWLIVPRHPQRFDEVARLIESRGFSLSRRSQWKEQPIAADVWLGDSLGEMALYYGLSQAALLGGSFEALGGQNLIEAAACACPVFMGPHTFNFKEAAELAQDAGAAMRVDSLAQALAAVTRMLRSPLEQAAMTRAAVEFSNAHRGAVDHTVAAICQLLGQQTVDTL
jgi:3-deoxy-D-manno-octulosonic-acid transferase